MVILALHFCLQAGTLVTARRDRRSQLARFGFDRTSIGLPICDSLPAMNSQPGTPLPLLLLGWCRRAC
eukprot:6180490-Pleurochrysis_carterae.AAC.1